MQGKKEVMLVKVKRWGKLLLLCFCPAIIIKIRQHLRIYEKFIIDDIKSHVKLPLRKRLWGWRHGYPSKYIALYNLNNSNKHRYLPDMLYQAAHPINGMFSNLIDNKLNLYYTLSEFRERLPAYYLLLYRNEIIPLGGHSGTFPHEKTEILLDLCREKGKLAMKRLADSLGEGFYMMSFDNGGFQWNGMPISEQELKSKCRNLENYLITEYVQQHQYARSLYPNTTNTLRIVTVRDYDEHKSHIAWTLQRIGRTISIPVDNVAKGGLVCEVNIQSGEIGPGLSYRENSQQPIWHGRHPDTGAQIAGIVISNWQEIRSAILKMADSLAMVPYMGWDVVIIEDGFKVLEINSLPHIDSVQFFKPLLDDERIRRFYAMHIPSLREGC